MFLLREKPKMRSGRLLRIIRKTEERERLASVGFELGEKGGRLERRVRLLS